MPDQRSAFKDYPPPRSGARYMGDLDFRPHSQWPKAKGHPPRLAGQRGVHRKDGTKSAGPTQVPDSEIETNE